MQVSNGYSLHTYA